MPYNFPTRRRVMLDGTSASSSSFTSAPFLIADFGTISLSWITTAAVASNLTVQMTNAEGFRATIAEGEWSDASIVPADGIFRVDPGARWMRALKPTVDSQSSLVLEGRY